MDWNSIWPKVRAYKKVIITVLSLIAAVIVLIGAATNVNKDEILVNQFLNGSMQYKTEPGITFTWWGERTFYPKAQQVWFNKIHKNEATGEVSVFGIDRNMALPIQYADKGKGYVVGSVRVSLPRSQAKLDLIQEEFGSNEALLTDLIEPTIGKVVLACGPLMTSLESVSDKRNDLIYYITDQLNYGIYKTQSAKVATPSEAEDPVSEEDIDLAEIVMEDGKVLRAEESPFEKFGITVSQLAISDFEYEKATLDQISQQRNADMQIITARANALRAEQEALTVAAQGEANAMKAKWAEEEKKATAVVQAQQAYEVAEYAALQAVEIAKKTKAEGEAEAYRQRQLVQAGLSPERAAEIYKDMMIGIAHEMAQSKVSWTPYVVTGGTGTNGGLDPMNAVGINQYLSAIKQLQTAIPQPK